MVPILLASLLNPLNRKYSAVEFEVIAQGTVEIQLCLLEGQTEITLSYDLDLHPKIERKTLWCLEPYVLLSNQHPLSELEGEPMVLFDGPNSHDHFNAILSLQNCRSTVQHRRDTFELVRSLVANDRGFSIVNLKPKTTECYDGEQVAYVPLQDPEGGPSVVIAILEAARRTAKAEVFWSHCKSAIPANLLDCRRRDSGGSGSPLYHVSVSLRPPGMRPQFGKH